MRDDARREAALKGAGLEGGLTLKQVHGVSVVNADEYEAGGDPLEADGWVSRSFKNPICVLIADCIPLVLWDPKGGAAGVFHVGWKGAAAGMAEKAVKSLMDGFAVEPGSLNASIGPHIGACCFKVGSEVASRFRRSVVSSRDGKSFVDLGAEVVEQLAGAGVPREAIAVSGECTSCLKDDFFSFRRDKMGVSLMAFLGRKK